MWLKSITISIVVYLQTWGWCCVQRQDGDDNDRGDDDDKNRFNDNIVKDDEL